jgi:hypothetical protein
MSAAEKHYYTFTYKCWDKAGKLPSKQPLKITASLYMPCGVTHLRYHNNDLTAVCTAN